jgi:hypothetical protein
MILFLKRLLLSYTTANAAAISGPKSARATITTEDALVFWDGKSEEV